MNFRVSICKAIVLVVAATVVVGCGGAESRKAKYLEKGKTYLQQENYDKAMVELKNVLQIDPKHAEAYYLIGQTEEARQNWRQAFGSYSKAVELNPDYLEAKARLARFYLLSGDIAKATEIMEAILASKPQDPDGRLLKAVILARQGKDNEAIKEASQVLVDNPAYPDAINFLASIYLKQNMPAKAIDILEKGTADNPESIPLRMELAKVFAVGKEYGKAERLMTEAIAIEPAKLQHRLVLSAFLAQTGQTDKAEKTLRETVQANPEDADRRLVLVDFLASQRSASQAEAELLTAIKEIPKAHKLRFGLAKLYERTEANDKIAQVYRDIIEMSGTGQDGLIARSRLADFLLKQGQREEAAKLIEEVLKENPGDNDALITRARLAMMKGDAQGAIADLRVVLRDQPDSVKVLSLLANAHMLNKAPELAKENLQKAVEMNPQDTKARLALVQFLAQIGDLSEALKSLDEAIKLSPKELEPLLAKAEFMSLRRDTKGVQSTLEKIKAVHPDKPVGYYRMGQFYMGQKKYDMAIHEFEQALKRTTDAFQPLSAIMGAYLAQGKPEAAIKRLRALIEESPNHPFVHELLAEVYISTKRYAEAEKELHEAIRIASQWNVPYRNLANLYLVQGNFPAAASVYQQGLQAIPEDTQLLLHMAEAYERTRDYDKAIATYERVLKKDADNVPAANNLASLLTDHKGDSKSLKRALELTMHFETSLQPAFRDTLGWVYYKSGEIDKAVPILKEVVKQTPNVPVFRYHLGMAYYKQGNLSEAKIQLAKALEDKKDFTGKDEARTTLQQIP